MKIKDNLNKLINSRGNLTLDALATATSIPKATLHHVLSGKTLQPRPKVVLALANYFQITPDQLVGISPLPQMISQVSAQALGLKALPVIPWPDLQVDPETMLNNLSISQTIVSDVAELSEMAFATHMPDTSMYPIINQHSLIILDPNQTIQDRDLVLIAINKESPQFMIRRLLRRGDRYYVKALAPSNDQKETQPLNNSDSIIAKLMEVRLVQFNELAK